ncbi:MAG: hypothetical protein LBK25_05005 [Treponema sp.]|nr:hypothetical protein [Treponema sp.]
MSAIVGLQCQPSWDYSASHRGTTVSAIVGLQCQPSWDYSASHRGTTVSAIVVVRTPPHRVVGGVAEYPPL